MMMLLMMQVGLLFTALYFYVKFFNLDDSDEQKGFERKASKLSLQLAAPTYDGPDYLPITGYDLLG